MVVAVGEHLEVQITGIGSKGDGVAKVDGFVIIVPHTNVKQNVKVRITRVRDKLAFAEVLK